MLVKRYSMYLSKPKKPTVINSLHPLTVCIFLGTLTILSASFTHPLYLGLMFLAVVTYISMAGALKEWKYYLFFGLFMVILIILVNALFSRAGTTIILRGPNVPVFGKLDISIEALSYGFNMAIKILLIISIFCLYSNIQDPDKTLSFLSRFAPKTAITVIMSVFMLPRLKRDIININQVMYVRGAKIKKDSFINTIRARYPILKILLLSSMEGSWDLGEALQARAFDSGKRTFYSTDKWQGRDSIVSAISISLLVYFIVCIIFKNGLYSFYPKMDSLIEGKDIFLLICLAALLFLVPLYNWGWKNWRYLRLRT